MRISGFADRPVQQSAAGRGRFRDKQTIKRIQVVSGEGFDILKNSVQISRFIRHIKVRHYREDNSVAYQQSFIFDL